MNQQPATAPDGSGHRSASRLFRLPRAALGELLAEMGRDGREVIGPTVVDHAIVLRPIHGVGDLPSGIRDQQAPGRYWLERRDDDGVFGHVVGPSSLKDLLFPPRDTLYHATRGRDGRVRFEPLALPSTQRAVIGVRACDLRAAAIQAKVFASGPYKDPRHAARQENLLVVGVNCLEPGAQCFCASMGTGPRVGDGADVALTERHDDFLLEPRTDAGRLLVDRLQVIPADESDGAWVAAALTKAEATMGRSLDRGDLHARIVGQLDNPRFEQIAERCLACGNCTAVCPTCFCSTMEESSTLDGRDATRTRLWESCFSSEHAEIHGGSFRPITRDRYRQWLSHKLGFWVAQFGESGCVGCGRCTTFCPAGIDFVAEAQALAADAPTPATPTSSPARIAPVSAVAASTENLVPRTAEVLTVARESSDVVTLHIIADGLRDHAPGQFNQLSLPGIGEVPISISGSDGRALEHTIRAVGAATRALAALKPGATLGVRGPYGRPWPLAALREGPVVIVAGGIGLAPLRGAIRAMLADPVAYPDVRLFAGARSTDDLLYTHEMLGWLAGPTFRLYLTVDHATPAWRGHVGVVTRLLKAGAIPNGARALVCGPEIMMRYAIEALQRLGVTDDRIWLTMERHMKCAVGFCGRCQLGPHFVCRDGPVFRFDEIGDLFHVEGL